MPADRLTTTLGKRLRYLRRRHGETQGDIAKACGVSRAAVTQWESDLVEPRVASLVCIVDHFGATYRWIMTGRGEITVAEFVRKLDRGQAPGIRVRIDNNYKLVRHRS